MENLMKKISTAYPGCTVAVYVDPDWRSAGYDMVYLDTTIVARYGSENVWQHTFSDRYCQELGDDGWVVD